MMRETISSIGAIPGWRTARITFRATALAAAALLATAASPAPDAASSPALSQDWTATVVRTSGGHVIGNPAARVKLAEYVSYTCPHCATFVREGEPRLKADYVASGRVSLEIRHLIRDPVDLTVALLTNCGPASRFPQNHSTFMLGQPEWIGPLVNSTAEQRERWTSGERVARHRAIAGDLGFYALMEERGYTRAEADRCLADEAMAKRLADNSAADWNKPGITGTPSFAIDGAVLDGTHSWQALEPQIAARF